MASVSWIRSLLLLVVAVALAAGMKDESGADASMEKREKWGNKGFSDYSHLRFGRADPDLYQPLGSFYPGYYSEKRALSDYGHLRFGRRMPSFTDYGHLRFGK